jgi:hypothetical protein
VGKFNIPLVYLDLNHFIALAKELKSGQETYLSRLRRLADAKIAAFPFSWLHMMEILAVGDPQQRRDIGEAIKLLCNRLVIRDYDTVLNMEISNILIDRYKLSQEKFPLPMAALGIGYLESMGHVHLDSSKGRAIDPVKAAEIEEFCWNLLLSEGALDTTFEQLGIPKMASGGPHHEELIQATERTRKEHQGKNPAQAEREYVLTMGGTMFKRFNECATNLNILQNGLHPVMPEEFRSVEFLSSVPLIDSWASLYFHLYHKDTTRPVKVNHLYDVSYLAVAVPYCDVIVCDKEMAHVIRSSKLDKKYGTTIHPRLPEAVVYLEKVTG